MHVGHDDLVLDGGKLDFPAQQEFRDDARHLPAMLDDRIGNGTHDTNGPAAIDEAQTLSRQFSPESLGIGHMTR